MRKETHTHYIAVIHLTPQACPVLSENDACSNCTVVSPKTGSKRPFNGSPYANMTMKMTKARVHWNMMQKATRATSISMKVGRTLNRTNFEGSINVENY